MKRSSQVSLVLMTVTGIGAGAYALAPNGGCRQSEPKAVPSDASQGCQSSHGSGHGFHAFSSGSGSSGATPAADTTSRGGFGGIGRGASGGE
jgi:hypothetical protein